MDRSAYLGLIRDAGFVDVTVVTEKSVDLPDALLETHLDAEARRQFREDGGTIQSITVTGRRPVR